MPGVQYIAHPAVHTPPPSFHTSPQDPDVCDQYLNFAPNSPSMTWSSTDNLSQSNLTHQGLTSSYTPWTDHPIVGHQKFRGSAGSSLYSATQGPSQPISHYPALTMPSLPQPQPQYSWSTDGDSNSTGVSPCSTPPLSVSGQPTPSLPFPHLQHIDSGIPPHKTFSNASFQQHQHHYPDDARDPDFPPQQTSHARPMRIPSPVTSSTGWAAIKETDVKPRTSSSGSAISTSPTPAAPRKISGACARCRRLKMKCEFKDGAPSCSRCTIGRHDCILEEKKPRTPGERERLLMKVKQREAQVETAIERVKEESPSVTPINFVASRLPLSNRQKNQYRNVLVNASTSKKPSPAQLQDIRSLLENEEYTSSGNESSSESSASSDDGKEAPQLDRTGGLPHHTAPIGFIAQASLEHEKKASFFRPGPLSSQTLRAILIERGEDAPQILTNGLFSLDDVEVLFDIFFKNIYPMVGLLDPDIHTPSAVLVRSPFLFTVICAMASRYLRFHPGKESYADVYSLAMHYAKTAAASALIDGRKCVEMCQAYILMSLYAPKGKRFDEDRTWFYSGVAMRLATDLGLHEIPAQPNANDERTVREWRNLIRTWLVCFNLDRSFSSQYGKPSALHEDQHVQNKSWYKMPFATSYDIHTQGHTDLMRVMSNFHERMAGCKSGSLSAKTIASIVEVSERELYDLEVDLTERYKNESDDSDEGCRFRASLNPFTFNYSRLLFASQGLQYSYDGSGSEPNSELLMKSLHAATTVVRTFLERVAVSGLLRYAPDCYFVFAGFAATFLLKLIDPRTPQTLDRDQTDRIIALVSALVHTLGSPEVVIDEMHAPKLYSRFLSGLLNRISDHYYGSSAPPSVPSSPSSPATGTPASYQAPYPQYDFQQATFPAPNSASSSSSLGMDFTSWDPVFQSPTMEYDATQQVGSSWTFAENTWDLPQMCPTVTLLNQTQDMSFDMTGMYDTQTF